MFRTEYTLCIHDIQAAVFAVGGTYGAFPRGGGRSPLAFMRRRFASGEQSKFPNQSKRQQDKTYLRDKAYPLQRRM